MEHLIPFLRKKDYKLVDFREKLEKNLGSISEMTRLPGALFVVDIIREHIAIKEAQKLNIPIFAMVDTNSDPREVDYVIPSNDDASKSIAKVFENIIPSIQDGLSERNAEKTNSDKQDTANEEKSKTEKSKTEKSKTEKPKTEKIKVEKVEVKTKAVKVKEEKEKEEEEEEE